jgi:integrase/recombinase XerD
MSESKTESRAARFASSWRVDKHNPGMQWSEAESLFLRSCKLGVYGATRAVRPRTIREYRWDLKKFFVFMKGRGITHYNNMSEKDVLDYVSYLQGNGWSKATQRKYLLSLKAFFHWVDLDPDCQQALMKSYFKVLPRIGKEIHRTFVPSQAQMQVFVEGFDRKVVWGLRDYTAVSLMLDTGARVGEVCNLEPDDFNWSMNLVDLEGKTGKRLVPFDGERLGSIIRNWMRVRAEFAHPDCKKVFISRYGGECTPDTFRQSFADNLVKTGLDKVLGENTISCHTLRHYFCTMYLVAGGTLHNLQRITGHKSLETLMIYVNLAQQISTVAEEHAKVSPFKTLFGRSNRRRTLTRLSNLQRQ